MRRRMIPCLMVIVLCATSGVARSSSPSPGAITDIRQIDFLSFAYHSSLCSKEFGKQGLGKTVRVRKGEFKIKNVYFTVDEGKVIFADVTGDGHEDAIVPIACGAVMANFSLSEVYVYTVKDGRATLLAEISDTEMERDYRRSYPDAESYWGLAGDIKVRGGNLEIEVLADGSHASPKYVVTLQYHLSGEGLRLVGKPQRRNASE